MTQRIIQIAQEHAEKHNADRVTEINLVVGEDSDCLVECIRLYFDLIAEGTCCETATLSVEQIKPKLRCASCGALFTRKPFTFTCPACGGEGEPTEIGREFYIKSIVVEDSAAEGSDRHGGEGN